jgi:hypothetical protein
LAGFGGLRKYLSHPGYSGNSQNSFAAIFAKIVKKVNID